MDGGALRERYQALHAHGSRLRDRAAFSRLDSEPLVADLFDTLWSALLVLDLATASAEADAAGSSLGTQAT